MSVTLRDRVLGRAPIKRKMIALERSLAKSDENQGIAREKVAVLERELRTTQGTLQKMTRAHELREAAVGETPGKKISKPKWNYELLFQYAEQNWMVTAAVNKIVQVATKGSGPGGKGKVWEWVPKFNFKCFACGADYQQRPDRCETPGCESDKFREPDRRQLDAVETLLDKPNPYHSWTRIMRGIIRDQEIVDDWFLEVIPSKDGTQPAELWLLNTAGMEIAHDDRGQLGNGEMFCPKCYGKRRAGKEFKDVYYDQDKHELCPKCGVELKETAYILRSKENRVVGRWAEEEIIHGNKYGCPTLFGKPKLVSLIGIVGVLLHMEKFQYLAYSEDETPDKIIAFPGMDTDQIQEMMLTVKEFKQANPGAPKNLALGVDQPPTVVDMMDSLVNLQAKEMQDFYMQAIAITYGVSLTSLGVQTPGKLGKETEVVEVSYETMEEVQETIEEAVNRFLVPKFWIGGGDDESTRTPQITDWEFRLISPKGDDVLRRANIQQTVANTVNTLMGIEGLEVEITDDWDIRISGKATGVRAVGAGGTEAPSAFSREDRPMSPSGALQKALSARNAPPDAVRGIRQAEEEFLAEVRKQYLRRIGELSRKGKTLTEGELRTELSRIVDKLDDDLGERVGDLVQESYEAGLEKAKQEFPEAAFESQDQGALDVLTRSKDGIIPALKTFTDAQRDIFEGIIRRAYEVPGEFDLGKMTRDMRRAALDETYKLERIARTETTKISSSGRAEQWKKYADPEDHYEWMIARDARTCVICQAIANGGTAKIFGAVRTFHGNPYTLKELEGLIPHFVAHPNCRCTVVRRASYES